MRSTHGILPAFSREAYAAMKSIIFWVLDRFLRGFGFKLVVLLGSVSIILSGLDTIIKSEIPDRQAKQNPNDISSTASMTLFVRLAGKLKEHRIRFYCDLFRTAVLFWPATFGKTVVVLDEESQEDHEFGINITRQVKRQFPDRKLEVVYESLPKSESVLNFPDSPKPPGYNRQLWSSFFIDLYTRDRIVAWMDTDAAFVTPVTTSTIFKGSRLRILGSECSSEVNIG